jgi:BlaI family transcriptional regulator, penicillinase repressor
MRRKNKKDGFRPTDGELAILQVLWQQGPSTVRQIHETLNATRPTGYTTVLKLMQIMTDKGLLLRDESQRSHIYRPQAPAEKTQRQLVRDLLERAFAGAANQLVIHALSVKHVPRDELAQIRALLDKMEGRNP